MISRVSVTRLATLILPAFACLIISADAASSAETPPTVVNAGRIEADTTWKGACRVTGTVTVAPGVTLRIEPGAVIRFAGNAGLGVDGRLEAVGTDGAPILLGLDDGSGAPAWKGVELSGSGTAVITFGRVDRATTGIRITGGLAELTDSQVTGCDKAIEATSGAGLVIIRGRITGNREGVLQNMAATAAISDSVFEGNAVVSVNCGLSANGLDISGSTFTGGQYGLLIKQAASVTVSRCTFSGMELGIGIDQAKTDTAVIGNVFTGDGTGAGIRLVNLATPYLGCNRFTGLATAVMAERFCSPLVTHNLFEGNKDGVAALFKSPTPVRRNVFRKNQRAVFADLASYVQVLANNFDGNERDVVLGISMSADYERRVGSRSVSQERAQKKGTHNMKIIGLGIEEEFEDTVDARGNWWGTATTAEMAGGGAGANITAITDGRDTPLVEYPGWAEGQYRMDHVVFDPWEKSAIPNAGPLPAGCPVNPADLPK